MNGLLVAVTSILKKAPDPADAIEVLQDVKNHLTDRSEISFVDRILDTVLKTHHTGRVVEVLEAVEGLTTAPAAPLPKPMTKEEEDQYIKDHIL
jgi:hypothetical protein